MKRTAIIIESSEVSGENPLPGAKLDATNWKQYLLSDLGGAWSSVEIHVLSHPAQSTVEQLISTASDGYTFVAFSGHGEEGSVALNDYQKSCTISKLKPKSSQGTLILDTCRGINEARSLNFTSNVRKEASYTDIANAGQLLSMNENFSPRSRASEVLLSPNALWFAYLQKAAAGIVEMKSCAKNESAGENPNAGGYYTQLLLGSSSQWHQSAERITQHTTKNAHDYAANLLKGRKQHPEYTPSFLEFPFAVKV